jgi:hypothetical protein
MGLAMSGNLSPAKRLFFRNRMSCWRHKGPACGVRVWQFAGATGRCRRSGFLRPCHLVILAWRHACNRCQEAQRQGRGSCVPPQSQGCLGTAVLCWQHALTQHLLDDVQLVDVAVTREQGLPCAELCHDAPEANTQHQHQCCQSHNMFAKDCQEAVQSACQRM